MTTPTAESYVAHITRESARFREVVATAGPNSAVPACPDWDVDDLLWHLAEVQWFWGTVIAGRPAGPPGDSPPRPDGRAATLRWFDEASSELTSVLAVADAAEPAWSWASDDQTVGFTLRRQAHEALIHRLDAEQSVGDVTPLPADLAADGVAELVEVMYGGTPPEWGRFAPSGRHTAVELTDTGDRIRVATGRFEGVHPESGRVFDDASLLRVDDGPAGAVIRGAAGDIDAWLWRRRDDGGISIEGDRTAYAEWRSAVAEPLD